jgi:hypothetical protein
MQADDLDKFRLQLKAAREYTSPLVRPGNAGSPVAVAMTLPTDHQVRVASAAANNLAHMVDLQRSLLIIAMVGWQGVNTTDLLPDAQPGDLPHSAEAAIWLLDVRQDWADVLWLDLTTRLAARTVLREVAAKNLQAASNGNAPDPMRPT